MPSCPMSKNLGKLLLATSVITCSLYAFGPHAWAQGNPDRDAFFGETHVHTSWSFDAYIFGNTMTGPADAYAYAKGQTIKHPLGYDIKIETPLDWMGVTDHSEYVGTVRLANEPGSAISKLPIAQKLIVRKPEDIQRIYLWLATTITENKPIKELISPEVAGSVWKENVDIADKANEPGKFTAFCSYEWTSTPDNRNMHRNIFFKDCAKVPELPYSSINSDNAGGPVGLDGRAAQCRQRAARHLAQRQPLRRPHVPDRRRREGPADRCGLGRASRDRNERLTEIKQIKGASETHPTLSPNDEFADFEILTYLLGDPAGRFPHVAGSYVRQALKDGIAMQEARGYNPYKMGFVGGSDSHNTGVPYRQTNFFGGHARNDGDIKQRMSGYVFAGLDVRLENPAGLTGVWAEENTRASLFDAMQRKETFATSGPHIKVRFFGGPDWAERRQRVRTGSRSPMPAACRWAATCRRCRMARRRPSSSGRSRTRPRATSTASRSSRAGPSTASRSRRSSTSPGPAAARPTRSPARSRRSAPRSTSPTPPIPTRSVRWS